MRLPFDPTREAELVAKVNGETKTYRLRFGMRELLVAEARLGTKTYADGSGIPDIIAQLANGTIDSLMAALGLMLGRHHEGMTNLEMWELFDANPDGVHRAVFEVFGKSLPKAEEPDPNEQPVVEILTEQIVPIET